MPFMDIFEVMENEYTPEGFDWPKPDGWLEDWPQHPMWVPPSDSQCNLCNLCTKDQACDCITTCVPRNKPRITYEGEKGQGVRVIGSTYVRDQLLGEWRGAVIPLDTQHDGWPIDFIRPICIMRPWLRSTPDTEVRGVRKVNSSCDPSAEFRA